MIDEEPGAVTRLGLFQNVREKHGLAYSIFTELNLYRDSGCLAVYSGTSTEHVKRVVGMVVDEFRRICDEPIPAEELRRAKDHLKGSLALSLESTSSRMSNLARQEVYFRRPFTLNEILEGIDQVKAEEVRALAREMFDSSTCAVAVLGNTSKFQMTKDDLEA